MDWPAGLTGAWHPVAYSDELHESPIAVTLMDRPLALFRTADGVAAVEDRCPHRGVPLSAGRVVSGEIECPYHGWRFDGAGRCTKVPGSAEPSSAKARAHPAREQAGLIWTTLADEPALFPALWDEMSDPAYDSFWWKLPPAPAAIGDAIENLLDPLHSYFLHPGLVRQSRRPQAMRIEVTSGEGFCDARFTERDRGLTLLQRLTEGSRVHSWARYRAPTQVQIAFDDARGPYLTISVVFGAVSAGLTRPYARFSTRKGFAPAWLKRLFLIAFHRPVLAQDQVMLKRQLDCTGRFGGPDYANGPLDFFGSAIWAALNGRPIAEGRREIELID